MMKANAVDQGSKAECYDGLLCCSKDVLCQRECVYTCDDEFSLGRYASKPLNDHTHREPQLPFLLSKPVFISLGLPSIAGQRDIVILPTYTQVFYAFSYFS